MVPTNPDGRTHTQTSTISQSLKASSTKISRSISCFISGNITEQQKPPVLNPSRNLNISLVLIFKTRELLSATV